MTGSAPSTRTAASAFPGCTLAAWAAAWQAGRCSPDDVADILAAFGDRHVVDRLDDGSGVTDPQGASGALTVMALLREVRRLSVRLPIPGDPQGLPPGPATAAAFRLGEVVVAADTDDTDGAAAGPLALLVSRDGPVCRWTVHRFGGPVGPPPLSLAEAEYALREGLSEATALIRGTGSRAGAPADLRKRLTRLAARLQPDLPAHSDPRADRVIESAAQVEAIVTLATGIGFGDTAGELASADAGLRRLIGLARAARAIAVDAVIEEYLPVRPG